MGLIELSHVSKAFRRQRTGRALLGRGGVFDWVRGRPEDTVTALRDINLTVEAGECVGLVGANGSGKSTLLKIIAGVTTPTSGELTVRGRVASLLELGAGFHPMLTGRENVYLNGSILGMRKQVVDVSFENIVEFSGIREFIDDPVTTYSSGMFVRLAFSVAIHSNPDIFLLDEILAVGDEEFQRKCRMRVNELREEGKTLLFVSHDLSAVTAMSNRCFLLRDGELIDRGSPQATIDYYVRQIGDQHGIHTMETGGAEAIIWNGRLSLFHQRREITSPRGGTIDVYYMNTWHNASMATWTIEEEDATSCTAVGEMHKLPVRLRWALFVREGSVTCRVSIELLKDTALDQIGINLFLPAEYDSWTYDDLMGTFSEIRPTDLAWVLQFAPEFSGRETGLLPAEGSELPPVYVTVNEMQPYMRLRWQNTDYTMGSRALQIWGPFPPGEASRGGETIELAEFTIDFSKNADDVRRRVREIDEQRSVHTAWGRARFEKSRVHLYHGETELTADVFLYTSVNIAGIWIDSHHLLDERPHREGDVVRLTAASPHHRFKEHFELGVDGDAVTYTAWLEALTDVEVEAYAAAIGLDPAYTRWRSAERSGDFPETGSPAEASANTEPGTERFVTAESETLPALTFRLAEDSPAATLAVLSPGARVIRAMHESTGGTWRVKKGMHLLVKLRCSLSA